MDPVESASQTTQVEAEMGGVDTKDVEGRAASFVTTCSPSSPFQTFSSVRSDLSVGDRSDELQDSDALYEVMGVPRNGFCPIIPRRRSNWRGVPANWALEPTPWAWNPLDMPPDSPEGRGPAAQFALPRGGLMRCEGPDCDAKAPPLRKTPTQQVAPQQQTALAQQRALGVSRRSEQEPSAATPAAGAELWRRPQTLPGPDRRGSHPRMMLFERVGVAVQFELVPGLESLGAVRACALPMPAQPQRPKKDLGEVLLDGCRATSWANAWATFSANVLGDRLDPAATLSSSSSIGAVERGLGWDGGLNGQRFDERGTFLDRVDVETPMEALRRSRSRSDSAPPTWRPMARWGPMEAWALRERDGPVASQPKRTGDDSYELLIPVPVASKSRNESMSAANIARNKLLAHELGVCRPCNWQRRSKGCKLGDACGYCHFEHKGAPRRKKKEELSKPPPRNAPRANQEIYKPWQKLPKAAHASMRRPTQRL